MDTPLPHRAAGTVSPPQRRESPLADEIRLDLFFAIAAASGYTAFMLLVLGSHTSDLFPWATSPRTAGTIGAAYAGSVLMCVVAGRARDWASVRTITGPIAIATAGVLLASILERRQLRLDGGPVVAYVASYLWLAVHGALLVLLARGLARQRRLGMGDPHGAPPMPGPLRIPLVLTGSACLGAGLALFLLPGHTGWWPWPLTPLDARVIGAWAVALGAGTIAIQREADLLRARPGLWGVTITAAIALLTLVRVHAGLSHPAVTIYAVVLLILVALGLLGLAGGGWSRRWPPGIR